MLDHGPYSYDPFQDHATWQLKFAWLPQRCDLTQQRIWFKLAYCGTRIITGPGDPVIQHQWHDKSEHIIWRLKHGK